ncbi:topology modulation protein [Sulfobacillus harzensis]|uniref:Topology modulation protein n=1 Tax=Sulfobacillus harzensis TaxID=2729629 RepID=A0A7Y0L5E8_9FIRM|nr:topology modulation protein [Sulfobacillus harzensis]NMP23637.1 topology modulation protein [Sulfobacillus harzensis]
MQRILVMGVSSGAGKSTFARRLSLRTGLPVYHLDAIFWQPGWVELSRDEFYQRQAAIAAQDAWIIEGNYTSVGYEMRLARADAIIYLEVSLVRCLYRIYKRRIQYRNTTRPDMGPGCPEKVDWAFLRFILTTYHRRRKEIAARLAAFQSINPANQVIWLRGSRQIESFWENFPAGEDAGDSMLP